VLHIISTEHSIPGDILAYIECCGNCEDTIRALSSDRIVYMMLFSMWAYWLVFQNERNMQESVSMGKNVT